MSEQRSQAVRMSANKAALLARWRDGTTLPDAARAIQKRAQSERAPLSYAQQRVWFLEQFQPGTGAYNLFYCARSPQPLEPNVLAGALDDLALRHESLRTVFRVEGASPVQVLADAAKPRLEVVDLRPLGAAAGRSAALARLDAAIHQPFDLSAGPLARVLLFQLEGCDLLGIIVHHLVADGW